VTDKERDKNAARRLAIIRHAREVTGNVALTCRYYGSGRQVFYRWLRRYEAEGPTGLRDRSKRPLHSPHETPSDVVGRSSTCGASTISARRRSRCTSGATTTSRSATPGCGGSSSASICRGCRPTSATSGTTASGNATKSRSPGHAVQVDVKFIAPLASSSKKKYYQFTAIDDCTRLRVLRIYDRLNQKTAIQFVDYLLDKLPFRVEAIQTDNGSEFQTAFHWHLADRGIRHVYIKPATPRLNGKVERSHRIDGEEFYRQLQGVVIDDTELFNDRLQEWQDFYNYHRPHGSLGGQTPYERLRQKTTAKTPE
jgi:transposase InsO family protein